MSKAYVKKQIGNIEEMVSRMETFRDTLQERYDKMSENRQESDKGVKLYEQIEALDSAISELENVGETLSVFNEDE